MVDRHAHIRKVSLIALDEVAAVELLAVLVLAFAAVILDAVLLAMARREEGLPGGDHVAIRPRSRHRHRHSGRQSRHSRSRSHSDIRLIARRLGWRTLTAFAFALKLASTASRVLKMEIDKI